MKSLDPRVLDITGGAEQQSLPIVAGGSIGGAVRRVPAKAIGPRAGADDGDGRQRDRRVRRRHPGRSARLAGNRRRLRRGGRRHDCATETLTIPAGVVPGFGGLHVELSSTAMVGLGEGARYLVEYPYGCAEQKGSRALALLLAADLGDAFSLPGIDPTKMRPAVAADAEGAREVPVRQRRLRLLARCLLHDVALSHRVSAPRLQDRPRT